MGRHSRAQAQAKRTPDKQPAPNGTVVVGIPSRGVCDSHFARTLADLVFWDRHYGSQHFDPIRPFVWSVGATQVVNARNNLVFEFLNMEHGDWLLMLDDDQLYPQHLLEHLMIAAHPEDRPIVGVPVWRFQSDGDDPNDVRSTHNVMDLHESGAFVEWTAELPPDSLVQVAAIGTGCLLIHRSVLVKMRDWSAERNLGSRWPWFRHNVWQPADMAEGEDLYFCRVAGLMGIPVFAHTFTTLGHVKRIILSGPVPPGIIKV